MTNDEACRKDIARIMKLTATAYEEALNVGFGETDARNLACSFLSGYITGLMVRPAQNAAKTDFGSAQLLH